MKLLLLLTFFFSSSLFAQEIDNSTLSGFKINKADIRKSLENLKKDGKISNADYLKSLKELNDMDDKKLEGIQNKAIEMIKSNPAEAQKMIETQLK